MTIPNAERRTDTASRLIVASARDIYRAMLDAESVANWRPPRGMSARIERFDARPGGGYRMAFIYDDASVAQGKTSPREDVFEGRFAELIPDERIVEEVDFESPDPTFAGTMRVITTLWEWRAAQRRGADAVAAGPANPACRIKDNINAAGGRIAHAPG